MKKNAPDPKNNPELVKLVLTETFNGESSRLELERLILARTHVKPSELALIAATLARNDGKKPSSKLNEAVALVLDADKLLHRLLNQPIVKERIPFDTWFAQKMPKVTDASYRSKKFFKYLMPQVREQMESVANGNNKPLPTGYEVKEETNRRIEELKREGIVQGQFAGFDAWCQHDKHVGKAKGGRAGAAQKQKNIAEKTMPD